MDLDKAGQDAAAVAAVLDAGRYISAAGTWALDQNTEARKWMPDESKADHDKHLPVRHPGCFHDLLRRVAGFTSPTGKWHLALTLHVEVQAASEAKGVAEKEFLAICDAFDGSVSNLKAALLAKARALFPVSIAHLTA